MLRQVGLIILSGCMVLTSWVVRPQTARALEVQCIEASKYKHLYLIFGNDRRKLAQYLRLNEANLPDAEACRALFVSGPMEPRARSRELGQPSDSDKLLQAIAENRGWRDDLPGLGRRQHRHRPHHRRDHADVLAQIGSAGPPGFYLLAGLHHASRCQERSRRTGIDRRRGSPRARGRLEELCPCSQRFCEVDRHRRARALRVSLHIRTCIRSRAARDCFCPSRAALAIGCGRQVDARASRAIAPIREPDHCALSHHGWRRGIRNAVPIDPNSHDHSGRSGAVSALYFRSPADEMQFRLAAIDRAGTHSQGTDR